MARNYSWNRGLTGQATPGREIPRARRCPLSRDRCGAVSERGPVPDGMVRVPGPGAAPAQIYCTGWCAEVGRALADVRSVQGRTPLPDYGHRLAEPPQQPTTAEAEQPTQHSLTADERTSKWHQGREKSRRLVRSGELVPDIEHGTAKGYRQHRYYDIEMCSPCRGEGRAEQARKRQDARAQAAAFPQGAR